MSEVECRVLGVGSMGETQRSRVEGGSSLSPEASQGRKALTSSWSLGVDANEGGGCAWVIGVAADEDAAGPGWAGPGRAGLGWAGRPASQLRLEHGGGKRLDGRILSVVCPSVCVCVSRVVVVKVW